MHCGNVPPAVDSYVHSLPVSPNLQRGHYNPSPLLQALAQAPIAGASMQAAPLFEGSRAADMQTAAGAVPAVGPATAAAVDQGVGLSFSTDWITPHAAVWEQHVLPLLAGKPGLRLLEIGWCV